MLSIIVVFSIGHFVQWVNLPMVDWLSCAGSFWWEVVFIAMGVLVSLLPSAQLMSVVGNIVYMALNVLEVYIGSGARKTDYFLPLREVTVWLTHKHPNS